MALWGFRCRAQKRDIREAPCGKVTVCFKKSNGYLLKVLLHLCLCFFFPLPVALSMVWSRFFAEVRRTEDNMTPQSHLRSLLIFDRSLNRYFGAKRDNGACRSTVRLSSFSFFSPVNTQICVMHVKSFAIEGHFQHRAIICNSTPFDFSLLVKGNRSVKQVNHNIWSVSLVWFQGKPKYPIQNRLPQASRCTLNSGWTGC